MTKPIYIGADHAGFELKEQLKKYFRQKKIDFVDLGSEVLVPGDDYPIIAAKVANNVVKAGTKGILICGSSFGVCIVANKKRGVRAAPINNVRDARMARQDDDANILCLAGRYTPLPLAKRIVAKFLSVPSSKAPRHRRRINEIKAFEQKYLK